MIEQLIHKALNTFTKESKEENSYVERKYICVSSSIDEGQDLTDIERKQHVFHETKKL